MCPVKVCYVPAGDTLAARWFDRLNGPVFGLSLLGFASVLVSAIAVLVGTIWAVLFSFAIVFVVFALMIAALADARRMDRKESVRFAEDV